MILSKSPFRQRLEAAVAAKHSRMNPFTEKWVKGELTRAQFGWWASQHYQYVSQFARWCAAGHRRATHKFNAPPGGPALPGNEAFGIHAMHPGKFAIFVGGFPIEVEGEVVGGIGVSGGSGEQDTQVGEAGIAALLRSLNH